MQKTFNLKKFISNNAIIILIVLLAIVTGFMTKNFFSVTNFKNLVVNVSPRFIIACGVSGYMLGVNPFNQPGVESYKKNMFALLGKPGFEEQREALLKRL